MRKLTDGQSFFLNAARYAAASMVAVYHILAGFFKGIGELPRVAPFMGQLGYVGVTIFFVLSGFVIAYTVGRKMSEQQGYSLKTYLVERFARISICLVPAVGVVALLDLLVVRRFFPDDDLRIWPHIFSTLFVMTGLTGFGEAAQPLPAILFMEHIWSLTYEVYLYLLFGLVVISAGPRRLPVGRVVLIAATLLLLSRLPYTPLMSYNWLLGALVLVLFRNGITPGGLRACLGLSGAVLLVAAGVLRLTRHQPEAQRHWIYVSLVALAFYALLALFGTVRVGSRLAASAAFLASFSYSMYLIHFALVGVAYNCLVDLRPLSWQGSGGRVLFLLCSFLLVNVLSFLFGLATERHTSRFRRLLLAVVGTPPAARP